MNPESTNRARRRLAELEETNESLREIKARFEAVYNHHYQLTGLLDLEGRLLMANRTALNFSGVQEREVIGRHFWETPWWTHSPEEQRQLREAIGRALKGESSRFESTHVSAEGETREIDFSISPAFDDDGEVIYLVPEGYDITERKATERSLRESEARYRATIEHAADALYIIDAEGRIVDVNQRACENLGYDREKLLSMRVTDVDPTARQDEIKAIWDTLSCGCNPDAAITIEGTHRRQDGSIFSVEVRAGLLKLNDEIRMLALARDVTERKRSEEDKEKLEVQLRQAQKMEAVGQLAGGVAHDLNNVLQAIVGYGELATREAEPESKMSTQLDEVMKAAKRASTLVCQLLAFSRRQVLELEVLNLDEVVDELAKMVRRVIGEHINLDIRSGPGVRSVDADRGQLEQILMNLCVNGRDAMTEGGTLTIATEDAELDAAFCREHVWARPGSYVLLSVSDTGTGMDETTQRQIFEPFFTTKKKGMGTGLGMSTVYGIVRQHHGVVDVQSELGRGTAIRIYLPKSASMPEVARETQAVVPPGGTEVILLAEDDDSVRDLARQSLESSGYTVLVADDGEKAIQLFDNRADEIGLALLDVVMPKRGGPAVFSHIRDSGAQIPVLFISGYSPDGVHTNFVLEEGMQLLQKPYRRDELLGMVRKVLDT